MAAVPWPVVGDSVELVIPWPRYPTETPGGRESRAKQAGRLVPWLSANVTNNLVRPVWAAVRGRWHDAAAGVAGSHWRVRDGLLLAGRVVVVATLHKRTASAMDPLAVLEGMKPAIDGLVAAGLLADDECVLGGLGAWRKAAPGDCRLELSLHQLE
jgi:hypothetical protein